MSFSPDGQRLASSSADRTVKVWDTATGQQSSSLIYEWDEVGVFVSSGKEKPGEWSLFHNSNIRGVVGLAFHPDGTRLATARYDGTVLFWDANAGQKSLHLNSHSDVVTSVAFSPDGQRLASASGDQTVMVWDVATGQALLALKGHTGVVWSVAFSPDGHRLASAGNDGTVKLWDVDTNATQFAGLRY